MTKQRIPQVWDELRRKIADVQAQLPPAVRGQSVVVDDFGDVYGIFLAVTGEGFRFPSSAAMWNSCGGNFAGAGVKSVALFGEQQRRWSFSKSRGNGWRNSASMKR